MTYTVENAKVLLVNGDEHECFFDSDANQLTIPMTEAR